MISEKPARRLLGLAAAALGLAGCAGGGANNQGATPGDTRNAVNGAAPANAVAPAQDEAAGIALDRQRLADSCIPRVDRARPIAQLGAARRAALNLCLNTETARQLAPRLPIRIGPSVRIDRVTVEDAALVYRYRLDRRLAELRPGLAERLEADTRRNACAGEDVQQTLALGGVQVYRWVDRDEALIREVRIARC